MTERHPKEEKREKDSRENGEHPSDKDIKSETEAPECKEGGEKEEKDLIELITDEEFALIKEKAAERDKLWDRLLRAAAEYENRHKRLERSAESKIRYALQDLLTDLLPVVDDLTRAIRAIEESTPETRAILEGVIHVHARLVDTLAKYNVTPIKTIGEKFDPNLHEAVAVIPTEDHPPSTVVDEVQPGWMLEDRVVRAPKVVVAAAPEKREE